MGGFETNEFERNVVAHSGHSEFEETDKMSVKKKKRSKIVIYDELNHTNQYNQYTKNQNLIKYGKAMRYNRNSGTSDTKSTKSRHSRHSIPNQQRTQSNDSAMSGTTRSITMMSASEEYVVDTDNRSYSKDSY